jgi:Outer membrane protein beta-barrel family/CarboxypepD_reg-like domain
MGLNQFRILPSKFSYNNMRMTGRLSLLYILLFFSFQLSAQTYSITGKVLDAKDGSSLIGVTVTVVKTSDTSAKTGAITDSVGNFQIDGVSSGSYKMHVEYIGYKSVNNTVNVMGQNTSAGTIKMSTSDKELKGVTVKGHQVRAEQLGDTTQFHADAYKTHPDATAEDLVTKMPGVTSDNTGVKVNGETVQQVYVDGKPFFGTDPTLALRNLPAEVIDKIQVFDKMSDQATFTGFDDGNAQKTINVVTKQNKSEGVFGKVYAGYGTDDTYLAGGNLNIFDGAQRISILALSNNINQQNFSSQDILGVTGGGGQSRGGGGGGGRGAFGGGGGGANNFLVNQQNGITTTNSFGINYSDDWGKKIKVTASYFYNSTDNVNNTTLARNYFTGTDNGDVYHETDNSETKNYNHRFNLRFEYNIDSANAIIFTPGISFQKNVATTGQTASTDSVTSDNPLSSTVNTNGATNSGYSSSNNLLFQHKFKKPRRTISFNINSSLNEKSGTGYYTALDRESHPATGLAYDSSDLNQNYSLYNNSYTVGGNLTYTEPLGKKSQIMVNYFPSIMASRSDKESYNFDPTTKAYTDFDDTLSNKYTSTYTTQKGGLSYRTGDKKLNFSVGANVQYATLQGQQYYPDSVNTQRNFTSVLPNMFFNYRFADGHNLRITYRTNTSAPTVTQLQDVVDVSNPLLLNTGNPNLKQDYEQTLMVRYGLTKSKTAHNFFVFLYGQYINNYIGSATYQPTKDSVFQGALAKAPVTILRGGQLTLPVNLDNYYNAKAFVTYGLPLDFMKSNLNLSGGFQATRTPGMVNQALNYSGDYIPSGGIVISSNVSEKLDFTLSYYGNYNIITNTLATTQANNNYYSHVAAFKVNYIFLKHFVVNSNITHNYYTAFSSTGTQSFYLWNAYVGYKLLKKDALEIRLSGFDLLNQNKSITRTVTGTYIENDVTNVLKQYFMLQLTYTIRNFKGKMPEENTDHHMFPGGGNWHGGNGGNGGPGGGGPGGDHPPF